MRRSLVLNLLSFESTEKEQYLNHGRVFAQSVGLAEVIWQDRRQFCAKQLPKQR